MNISLARWPWYVPLGVLAALAAVGVGVFYWYYERPVAADIAARQTQLQSIRADIDKAAATARRLDEFRRVVGELESRLSNLRAVLPEEKDAADLLRRMQTVATESNLTIKSFKPAPIVSKQLHAEWPISLELGGTYHNLAVFFDRVGTFTRIVNITGLDIKGKEKPDAGSTIDATCVATTFVLLDQAAVTKKPADPRPPAATAKPAD